MIACAVDELASNIALIPEGWAIAVSNPAEHHTNTDQLRNRLTELLAEDNETLVTIDPHADGRSLVQQLAQVDRTSVALVIDMQTLDRKARQALDGARTLFERGLGVVLTTTVSALAGLRMDMPHLWSWIGARIYSIESRPGSATLTQHFDIDDKPDVEEFLARQPGVQPLLLEAAREISDRFGDTRCRLGILRDPEMLKSVDLTVLIPWPGTAEEVIPLTDSLEAWWLEQDPALTDRVIIDVTFPKA